MNTRSYFLLLLFWEEELHFTFANLAASLMPVWPLTPVTLDVALKYSHDFKEYGAAWL